MRTDGPPFFDIKAKQGKGFDIDFERCQKFLGPGKVSRARGWLRPAARWLRGSRGRGARVNGS